MTYALKVIWLSGVEEYVREGPTVRGLVARFTKREAEEKRNFMLIGMSEEVQSINVVEYPKTL